MMANARLFASAGPRSPLGPFGIAPFLCDEASFASLTCRAFALVEIGAIDPVHMTAFLPVLWAHALDNP